MAERRSKRPGLRLQVLYITNQVYVLIANSVLLHQVAVCPKPLNWSFWTRAEDANRVDFLRKTTSFASLNPHGTPTPQFHSLTGTALLCPEKSWTGSTNASSRINENPGTSSGWKLDAAHFATPFRGSKQLRSGVQLVADSSILAEICSGFCF
jgi:hypothetical protein